MMKHRALLLCALAATTTPSAALAADAQGSTTHDDTDDDSEDDDVEDDGNGEPVISVAGSRVEARSSGAQTTLTADDVTRRNARTLADVLRQEAGIQVTPGVGGLGDDVMVDGLDGRHVLVLVNGRPLNGRVNQRLDLSRIPVNPESIEKIEVVRGAASAVNGSEAMGAVIAITTKRARARTEGSVRVDGAAITDGSPVSGTAAARVSGMAGPLLLSLDGSVLRGVGPDRNLDRRGDVPDRLTTSVRAEATTFVGSDHELRADALVQTQAAQTWLTNAPVVDGTDTVQTGVGMHYGGSFGLQHTLDVDLRIDRYGHRALKLPSGGVEVVPPLCFTGLLSSTWSCPAPPRTLSDTAFAESRVELTERARWLDGDGVVPALRTAVGVVLARDTATRLDGSGTDTLNGQAQRLSPAAYVEVGAAFLDGWLDVSTGVRTDGQWLERAGTFDGAVSPKLGASVVLMRGDVDVVVRGSVARGFRAPSVQERFLFFDHSELGYVVSGNSALSPEHSTTARGGLEVQLGDAVGARVSLDAFVNAVEDLIVEVPAGTSSTSGAAVFSYDNAARAITGGLNVAAQAGTEVVRLDVTAQWLPIAQDSSACPADDLWLCSGVDGARALPLRPTWAAHAGVRFAPQAGTELYLRADLLGERVVDVDTTAPAFADLGVTLQQQLAEHVGVLFAVDNLLDQFDATYGPRPGRVFRTSLVIDMP